jgi:Uncharacterized protein conserved in bacteria
MANNANLFIVWIGRFRSKTGYGKATRDYFYSLKNFLAKQKKNDVYLCGIDSGSKALIDAEGLVRKEDLDKKTKYVFPQASSVVVICHELASYWGKVDLSGRTRLIGLTVHEFLEQALGEKDWLTLPSHVWVPSEWNKRLLVEGLRFAEDFVSVVPHVYAEEAKSVESSNVVLKKIRGEHCFSFLLVISNLERKNASLVLSAFLEEFDNDPNVRLIVKLPAAITKDELVEKILPINLGGFTRDQVNSSIILVRENFNDAEMNYLRSLGHCLINAETSKGFDLDALHFLGSGRQVAATYVGGFTEFARKEHVYEIPLDEVQFFSSSNFNNEAIYSNVVAPSPSIAGIRKALRHVYEDWKSGKVKNDKQSASEVKSKLSPVAISQKIFNEITQKLEDHDFVSLLPPSIEISHDKVYQELSFPYQKLSSAEVAKIYKSFKSPSEYVSKDEWLADRRKLFGQYGGLPLLKEDQERLEGLRNKFSGKRCFVIGNGPSLNKMDLGLLKNEYTFCSNKFYLKLPDLDWVPSFYTCLDWRVTPDDSESIDAFFKEYPQIIKFLPNRFKQLFSGDSSTYWYFSISSGRFLREKFEMDPVNHGLRGGGTVSTAMLQLAAFMGFKEIYLIGTDVTYVIPPTVIQEGRDRFNTGVKINLTSTQDDDPNHFIPSYFGAGARWHDPNVPEMKRGFRACYLAAKLHGVNIYNATVGGALDCVPRVKYESLFKN